MGLLLLTPQPNLPHIMYVSIYHIKQPWTNIGKTETYYSMSFLVAFWEVQAAVACPLVFAVFVCGNCDVPQNCYNTQNLKNKASLLPRLLVLWRRDYFSKLDAPFMLHELASFTLVSFSFLLPLLCGSTNLLLFSADIALSIYTASYFV